MNKIVAFVKKHWDIVLYLVFGVLTTVVSYVVYYPCFWVLGIAWLSEVISWVVAVAFAYLTNKPWVFKSHDWSMKVVAPELMKFVGCRLSSLLLSVAILLVFSDILGFDGNVMKLVTSVVVIIVNYVGSKLLVFKK